MSGIVARRKPRSKAGEASSLTMKAPIRWSEGHCCRQDRSDATGSQVPSGTKRWSRLRVGLHRKRRRMHVFIRWWSRRGVRTRRRLSEPSSGPTLKSSPNAQRDSVRTGLPRPLPVIRMSQTGRAPSLTAAALPESTDPVPAPSTLRSPLPSLAPSPRPVDRPEPQSAQTLDRFDGPRRCGTAGTR